MKNQVFAAQPQANRNRVILSERSESKDLRISFPFAVNLVPGSLDALRLLGMTAFFAVWEPAKIVNCQLSIVN